MDHDTAFLNRSFGRGIEQPAPPAMVTSASSDAELAAWLTSYGNTLVSVQRDVAATFDQAKRVPYAPMFSLGQMATAYQLDSTRAVTAEGKLRVALVALEGFRAALAQSQEERAAAFLEDKQRAAHAAYIHDQAAQAAAGAGRGVSVPAFDIGGLLGQLAQRGIVLAAGHSPIGQRRRRHHGQSGGRARPGWPRSDPPAQCRDRGGAALGRDDRSGSVGVYRAVDENGTGPANAGQKQARGRFPKGRSGNPAGKPRGTRNRALAALDKLGEDAAKDVLTALITKAKAGDVKAGEAVLARVWPARKGRPVRVDLPALDTAAGLPGALGRVAKAVSEGTLTPEEGQAIASLLEGQRRAIETDVLERRIAALEDAAVGKRP